MKKEYNKVIGEALRQYRKKNNLTQLEVGEKVGLNRDAIIRIEKGIRNITIDEVREISNLLNVSIEDMLYKSGEEVSSMKGIILAGGSGTRLYPITEATSKQLVNIYDKPMIYYPLSTLMTLGIRDILIITTREDQANFKRLLGNGSQIGLNLVYEIQERPEGLAQAFLIGEKFIGDDPCAMILGDNIFYGSGLKEELEQAEVNAKEGYATIFGYQVKDPERFGIMELDQNNNVLSVEEKPISPKSDYAISGLYFYPKGVSEKARLVKPSKRGELEITTLNELYLKEKKLKARVLGEGYSWFDTGTFDSLLEASNMIKTVENNRDSIICCPEKIAYDNKWISHKEVLKRAEMLSKNRYGQYLLKYIKKN